MGQSRILEVRGVVTISSTPRRTGPSPIKRDARILLGTAPPNIGETQGPQPPSLATFSGNTGPYPGQSNSICAILKSDIKTFSGHITYAQKSCQERGKSNLSGPSSEKRNESRHQHAHEPHPPPMRGYALPLRGIRSRSIQIQRHSKMRCSMGTIKRVINTPYYLMLCGKVRGRVKIFGILRSIRMIRAILGGMPSCGSSVHIRMMMVRDSSLFSEI